MSLLTTLLTLAWFVDAEYNLGFRYAQKRKRGVPHEPLKNISASQVVAHKPEGVEKPRQFLQVTVGDNQYLLDPDNAIIESIPRTALKLYKKLAQKCTSDPKSRVEFMGTPRLLHTCSFSCQSLPGLV